MIGSFFISWLVYQATQTLSEFIDSDKLILNLIKTLLSCGKCIGFWTTLIYTQEFLSAAVVSFLMFLYGKISFLNNTTL